jgi:hypothetical protein
MKGRRRPARGEATEQAAGGEDVAVAVARLRRGGWGDAVRAVSFVGLMRGFFHKLSSRTTFIGRREYNIRRRHTTNPSTRVQKKNQSII